MEHVMDQSSPVLVASEFESRDPGRRTEQLIKEIESLEERLQAKWGLRRAIRGTVR
jgi:hypothetical protein